METMQFFVLLRKQGLRNKLRDVRGVSFQSRSRLMERRTEDRYPYKGLIFFATYNGTHEARLLNFSNSGLFIKTHASPCIGELITIAVPYLTTNNLKRKAVVVWSGAEGIGVKFVSVH